MRTSIGHSFGSNLTQKIPVPQSRRVFYLQLQFGGINKEITPTYFWLTEFRNYTNKGFKFIKIEDVHHFSEASQFGANMRQIKGGGIRAFQENLNQIIQLIKVHLMPLLKEVKQAHMYKIWFDRILENDQLMFEELEKSKTQQNLELIKKYRNERNEAINHLKDKWVSEVDGGKLWQISRSSQEQGLDMTLLPQLFFATYLDDPFERKKTLKEQLDESTYKVDITHDAKTQVARFQYRFYTWLPTAIKDTQSTFNIKLASLRQFYAQIEMHMQFMRPLLLEIMKKSEGMHHGNFYSGFGDENPNMVKLFDTSLTTFRVIGPQQLVNQFKLIDLEPTKYGLYIPKGALLGKNSPSDPNYVVIGCVTDEKDKENIKFYEVKEFRGSREDLELLSRFDFNKLPTKKIAYEYFKPFATPELLFQQERRTEIIQTPQGMQQVPFMINEVNHYGHVWNFVEIAIYRQKIRSQDIQILEGFIQELGAIKDELLLYLNYQDGDPIEEFGINFSNYGSNKHKNSSTSAKEGKKEKTQAEKLFGWIPIIGDIVASEGGSSDPNTIVIDKKTLGIYNKTFKKSENAIIEEVWKAYNIYKKVNGFVAY
ncbi:MAG: hypothetical protein LAT82_00460 [Nanoarchaeota archaeon]|nr:hypothetical protein [Nanoarchaeota archaeon]